MKTIGQIIKESRSEKKYSYLDLEEKTKIKGVFIEAIENQKWDSLPPFPTVLGFVKSLSEALDVDEKLSVAVLKRDYPPRKLNINPKPDVSNKFIWSPRLTFIVGIVSILVLIFGYLGFQYYHFISPPRLLLESPVDGQMVTGGSVLVFGLTDSDAKITVDNQPVVVGDDGHFSVNISVSSDTKEIKTIATNRSGKSTSISRRIEMK